ncbi:MAG: hypothetical protein A2096_14910 [Spirochaetes bacterium GWF1_41_5]|nr:MAG: hypothetical protein A2096_14910 [Spirochaetes bacterium GWF1_41_5]
MFSNLFPLHAYVNKLKRRFSSLFYYLLQIPGIFFIIFSFSTAQEFVGNGDFEKIDEKKMPKGWSIEKEGGAEGTVAANNEQAHSGKYSVRIESTSETGYIHPSGRVSNSSLQPGNYIYSLWTKSDCNLKARMQIYDTRIWNEKLLRDKAQFQGGCQTKEFDVTAGEWRKIEMTLKVTEACTVSLQIGIRNSKGVMWLDDVTITCTPAVKMSEPAAVNSSSQLNIYDSISPLPADVGTVLLEKKGFKKVTGMPASDLIIENGKFIAVLRKAGAGIELYYRLGSSIGKGAFLLPAAGIDTAANTTDIKIIKNEAEILEISIRYSSKSGKDLPVEISITAGRPTMEVKCGAAIDRIISRTAADHLVMPDPFSEDTVISANNFRSGDLNLPGIISLLFLRNNGEAIFMINWSGDKPCTRVQNSEKDGKRFFSSAETIIQENRKIFFSLLAEKNIWWAGAAESFDRIEDRKMDWTPPFSAAWRMTMQRMDGSWSNISESWWSWFKKDGSFSVIGSWKAISVYTQATRKAWMSGMSGFIYPFYIENDSAFLRLSKFEMSSIYKDAFYGGLVLLYPLDAEKDTPEPQSMPFKIMENSMPEKEFSLYYNTEAGIKNRNAKDKWPATCGVTEQIEKIFDSQEEKNKKEFIIERLNNMDMFVMVMRSRIEEYLAWQKEMQVLINKSRGHNSLQAAATEIEGIMSNIPGYYAEKAEIIKNPEYAKALSKKIIDLIDGAGDERAEQVKDLGRQIRTIGGGQDSMLGRFRTWAKLMRLRAGLLFLDAQDPELRNFLEEVHSRTVNILRIKYGMEGK